MDGQKLLQSVQAYEEELAGQTPNLYDFANRVAEAQREQTALAFEALGFNDIAAKVRAT